MPTVPVPKPPSPSVPSASGAAPTPRMAVPQPPTKDLSSHAFGPAKRTVPSLLYSDLPESVRAKGFTIPNHGDIVIVSVRVTHLPTGDGPVTTIDGHFRPEAAAALRRSMYAAAIGTGYDPRYLDVELTLPAAPTLDSGIRVDGPSAGLAWAVAIASALLGDPLRPDVCLTGTMNEMLDVGRVGGIEHKIEGCHKLGYRELLIPAGQESFELDVKRQSFSIKVSPVSTLGEAYEIATGQSLRPAR